MVIFKRIVCIKKCLSTKISTDRQHQGEGASRRKSNIANMSAKKHTVRLHVCRGRIICEDSELQMERVRAENGVDVSVPLSDL